MGSQEKEEAQRKADQLRPGDIILSKTPSTVFDLLRKLAGNTYYDHLVRIMVTEGCGG